MRHLIGRKEGRHVAKTGASLGFSLSAAPVWGFSDILQQISTKLKSPLTEDGEVEGLPSGLAVKNPRAMQERQETWV